MGLDIEAVSGLVPIEESNGLTGRFQISQELIDLTERNFPGRCEGLTAGLFLGGNSLRFRAGSYGGYNDWREWLAKESGHGSCDLVWRGESLAGHTRFVELINFSDCEGYIGPVTSAKLWTDFQAFERLRAAPDGMGDLFQLFEQAFKFGLERGVVQFF
jgi:hypothetical protein